ncbi:MAG: hypothetical protein ACR2OC_09530 [Solirubrobacterales bacterium]
MAAFVAALAIAAPASAACGGVKVAYPTKNVSRGPAPLAIGDSSMLLALPDLAKRGFKANARGCRQMPEGLDVIRKAKQNKALPKLVVLALGADGTVSMGQIRDALHMLGRKKKLGLVVPVESGGGTGHDAAVVREAAQRFDKQIRLLDWPNFSNGHPGWFQPDGLHLTFPGAAAFARLLSKALKNLPPPK